jgi:MerR family copper efflux transcriptional regulator
MKRRLRIGDLARQTGLSTDTLRHYERLHLLPVLERTSGGFREYPPDAVRRVKVIQQALALGFGLEELTQFFIERAAGRHPCRAVRRLAQLKLDALEERLEAMKAARDALHALLRDWDRRLERGGEQPARLLDSLADVKPFDGREQRTLRRKRAQPK